MCTVSMIGDGWANSFPQQWPQIPTPTPNVVWTPPAITRGEFEELKKEVESLKKLLIAAKIYDEETNQPDCHMEEKVDLIKKIAEFVGVDLEDIFKNG